MCCSFEGSWTWFVREKLSLMLFLSSSLEDSPRRLLSVPAVSFSGRCSRKGLSVSSYVLSLQFCREIKTAVN